MITAFLASLLGAGRSKGAAVTYATLDPTRKSAALTLSNGNLTVKQTGSDASFRSVVANIGKEISVGGKWYFEIKVDATVASNDKVLGVCNLDFNVDNYIGQTNDSLGAHYNKISGAAHALYNGGYSGNQLSIANAVANDVFGVLIDLTADALSIRLNNGSFQQWPNALSVPLSTIANNYSGTPKKVFPAVCLYRVNAQLTVNFGAAAFSYPVPSGANAGWYE